MLNMIRPLKPDNFQEISDAELLKVSKQVVDNQEKLNFNEKFWGNYKSFFIKAQHDKCGYCDTYISSYGDMEHYRPKSVVEDIKNEGIEKNNLHNVKGRAFKKSCKYGYWWLAYEWSNYLLSCPLCNQPWKRALFPISKERPINMDSQSAYPHLSPQPSVLETALLLNPFDNMNISDHITFDQYGSIAAYNFSEYGKQTIRTCGLDRNSLNQQRIRLATRTYKLIQKFANATEGSIQEFEYAALLIDLGQEEEIFSGMVRILFEHNAGGYIWTDLEKFVDEWDEL